MLLITTWLQWEKLWKTRSETNNTELHKWLLSVEVRMDPITNLKGNSCCSSKHGVMFCCTGDHTVKFKPWFPTCVTFDNLYVFVLIIVVQAIFQTILNSCDSSECSSRYCIIRSHVLFTPWYKCDFSESFLWLHKYFYYLTNHKGLFNYLRYMVAMTPKSGLCVWEDQIETFVCIDFFILVFHLHLNTWQDWVVFHKLSHQQWVYWHESLSLFVIHYTWWCSF